MLVLKRKLNEAVIIIWDGKEIGRVMPVALETGRVRLGFSGPATFLRDDAKPRRPPKVDAKPQDG